MQKEGIFISQFENTFIIYRANLQYIAYYNSKRLHYYKDLKKYMAPLQRRSLSAIQA